MDELATQQPGRWAERRRDLSLLLLLLLLAAGLRAWVLWTTEVPARDSIGFIRAALQYERFDDWAQVVKGNHQHPGYPLTILAVSLPVQHFYGETCDTMQFSAQLASSLAGLLLVIPMYFLGKDLFSRGVGFWAALLFQCLPASGHVLSDAISDSLYLFLITSSLCLALRALRDDSPLRFALAGAWCGLAYLTRPEGALMLGAAGAVLLAIQVVPGWRRPWKRVLLGGLAMTATALVVGSPYYLTTGCFTVKPSIPVVIDKALQEEEGACLPPPRGPLFASVLAVHMPESETRVERLQNGLFALSAEFLHSYQYIGWLPALVGMWWFREHYRTRPEVWVVMALFVLHGLLLWWLASALHYLSDRHILLLILCTIFQTVAVLREAPQRLLAWLRSRAGSGVALLGNVPAWSLVLLLLWTGVALSRTLQPLHTNRAGHHAAGLWLAANTNPWDRIRDDHCWAHYYSGGLFREFDPVKPPAGQKATEYVVISRANEHRAPSHQPTISEDNVRADAGAVVYHWPPDGSVEKARVLVYRMPGS